MTFAPQYSINQINEIAKLIKLSNVAEPDPIAIFGQ
jgi:hypothetical protein